MANIHQKINLSAKIGAWQRETDSSLKKNSPVSSSKLQRSITSSKSVGPRTVIEYRYYLYGKFVDMGVGRGRTASSKGESRMLDRLEGKKGKKRSKKGTWYQAEMYKRTKQLEGIIANYYGDEFINNIHKLPQLIEL